MNNPIHSKARSLAFLVSAFAWPSSHAVTPVLDRHGYTLESDVNIDLVNKIISFSSNMTNCQQADGSPPSDTNDYALHSNDQFIGLRHLHYDTRSNQLLMNSETRDVLCDNAQLVDPLFDNGFDGSLQVQ